MPCPGAAFQAERVILFINLSAWISLPQGESDNVRLAGMAEEVWKSPGLGLSTIQHKLIMTIS